MKRIIIALLLLSVLVVIALYAAGSKYTLSSGSNASVVRAASKAYADSRTDTVIITRDAALSALAFGCHWRDSVSVTLVTIKRLVNGVLMGSGAGNTAPLLGDTLVPYTSFATTIAASKTAAITLAPLCDQYMILIVYAGSANGVTSATVDYEAIKHYAYKQ